MSVTESVVVETITSVANEVTDGDELFIPVVANFDGATGLYRAILAANESSQGTVSLWISRTGPITNKKVYDIGDTVTLDSETTRFVLDGTGNLDFKIAHYTGTVWQQLANVLDAGVPDDTMHHVFMTFRNDTIAGPGTQIMQVWIDGVFFGSDTIFGSDASRTVSFLIGDRIVIGGRHDLGQLIVGSLSEFVTYEAYFDPVTQLSRFYSPQVSPGWPNGTPVNLGVTGIVNSEVPGNYLGGPGYTLADWNAGVNQGTNDDFLLFGGPLT